LITQVSRARNLQRPSSLTTHQPCIVMSIPLPQLRVRNMVEQDIFSSNYTLQLKEHRLGKPSHEYAQRPGGQPHALLPLILNLHE
jgi:hypothetical protein